MADSLHGSMIYVILIIVGALAVDEGFLRSDWPVHIYDLQCTGVENEWRECSFTTSQSQCSSTSSVVAAIYCLPNESEWCNMEAINITNLLLYL